MVALSADHIEFVGFKPARTRAPVHVGDPIGELAEVDDEVLLALGADTPHATGYVLRHIDVATGIDAHAVQVAQPLNVVGPAHKPIAECVHTDAGDIILPERCFTAVPSGTDIDSKSEESGSVSLDETSSDDDQDTPSADSSADPSGGDVSLPELRGPCTQGERIGRFVLQRDVLETYISGNVREGVLPSEATMTELDASGSCRLMRSHTPQCDPLCTAEQACHPEDGCIPYPNSQSVGSIEVGGLFQPLTLDPRGDSNRYFDTDLLHPAYEIGMPIALRAPGDTLAGFELFGSGVSELELDADEIWPIDPSRAFDVRWPVGGDLDIVGVRLEILIDQHGTSPAHIECDFADEGDAQVPGKLITQLFELGISGFPSMAIARRSIDSVTTADGCVEFEVSSQRIIALEIDGHTACLSDDDCPDDQVCDQALETCVDARQRDGVE